MTQLDVDALDEVADGEAESAYVNEDCPAECSEQHASPEPNSDGQWCCPESGDWFVYYGEDTARAYADLRNWTNTTRQLDESRCVGDLWYPLDDLCWCDECDGYINADDYGGDDLCYDHYSAQGGYSEDGYAYNNPNYNDGGTESVPTCAARGCDSQEVAWYHVLTEKVYCGDHVRKMKKENAREIPKLTVVTHAVAA